LTLAWKHHAREGHGGGLVVTVGSVIDLDTAAAALHRTESANAQRQWRGAWPAALTTLMVARRGFLTEYDEPWMHPWQAQVDLLYERALAGYAKPASASAGLNYPAPNGQPAASSNAHPSQKSATGYSWKSSPLAATPPPPWPSTSNYAASSETSSESTPDPPPNRYITGSFTQPPTPEARTHIERAVCPVGARCDDHRTTARRKVPSCRSSSSPASP
jgi:hypothetical protein